MNKSESKYFNTASKMDEAFLDLLSKKDFAYITVKEICDKAGVNRSTFYLHYETVSDLLSESIEYMNGQFLDYIKHDSQEFVKRLKDCPLDELYLITPEYLNPPVSVSIPVYIQVAISLFIATSKAANITIIF